MAKVRLQEYQHGERTYLAQYEFMCPGCKKIHTFRRKIKGGNHDFNMNLDKPTISPSWLQDWVPGERCHLKICDGFVTFFDDCWHELAGKVAKLEDLPELTEENENGKK